MRLYMTGPNWAKGMIILQTKLNFSSHKTITIALLAFVLLTGFAVPILYNQFEKNQIRSQTELYAQQLQEQKSQQAIRDQQIEDAASAIQYEAERDSYKKGNTAYADKDYLQAIEWYKKIRLWDCPGPDKEIDNRNVLLLSG